MKLAVIASTYPRSEDDVAVPWLREEVSRLARAGYEVTVFAPSYKGLPSHEIDGVEVERFRYFFKFKEDLTHDSGAPSKVHKASYFSLALFYLVFGTIGFTRLYRKRRFDIVHVHWPFPHANFVNRLTRNRKFVLVLNFHGAELALARKYGFVKKNLAKRVREADAVIANSGFTADIVKKTVGEVPIQIIPFGCPIDFEKADSSPQSTIKNLSDSRQRGMDPVPAEGKWSEAESGEQSRINEQKLAIGPQSKIKNQKSKILYVGRLIERKGVEYLIEAFDLLRKEHDAELVIVGSGFLHEKLNELVVCKGLASSVKLLADVGNESIAHHYLNSTVFALPAIVDSKGDTEGLGVVLIEAMTFGLPVVASNVGGIPDVVVDGVTGLLVPEKDPVALKEALLRVICDEPLRKRLVEGAERHVRRTFSWPSVIERLDSLYRSLAEKGNKENSLPTVSTH